MRGGIPRSVSTPYSREQWNEQAPGIPRQPAHNHRNCHRCRGSATYLDRGEQGPLYACRGNRRVVPSTGQRPPSLDRTMFRRAPHRAPRRAPSLFDWEGVLVRKDATSVRIRLSGTRMEGVLHEGRYPVYLSAFTDLACVEEMLRSAEYERRNYALIADISEDLPFEYDFETDTIAYTQKYHKVFGHEPIIPRFRERLGRGEAIDPVSEGFREPFLALDAGTLRGRTRTVPAHPLRPQALVRPLQRQHPGHPRRCQSVQGAAATSTGRSANSSGFLIRAAPTP